MAVSLSPKLASSGAPGVTFAYGFYQVTGPGGPVDYPAHMSVDSLGVLLTPAKDASVQDAVTKLDQMLTAIGGTLKTQAQNGFTPAQTYVAVPAFLAGNTAGPSGSNATVVQVVAANANRASLEVINNGAVDVELWFVTRPADADVAQSPKKGVVLFANGGGRSWSRSEGPPLSAIYAAAAVAGGLSIVEG